MDTGSGAIFAFLFCCSSTCHQITSLNQSAPSRKCVYSLCPLERSNCILNHLPFVKAISPMKIGNTNALNREVDSDGMRDWSFRLFDCHPRCRLCAQINASLASHRVANPIFRFMGHVLSLRHLWAKQAASTPSAAPKRPSPRRRGQNRP